MAVVFAVMLGATAWGLLERYTGVRAGVVAYGDITETSITITLQVVRPPDVPVVCDVAAVGENQIDVGAAQIAVPAGEPDEVIVSTIIETATPPKAARLLACRPADTDVATPSAAVATDVVAADAV